VGSTHVKTNGTMNNELIKWFFLVIIGILFFTSFGLVNQKGASDLGVNTFDQKINADAVIKTFDSFFLTKGIKENYSSCAFVKSEVKGLHELFLEKYPELIEAELSYDICIKANENKYYYFDYAYCELINNEAVPKHIIDKFDKIRVCMLPTYWSNTKKVRFKNRTYKFYKDLNPPVYIEMWYN